MFGTILVGYDDSDSSRDALALAGRLGEPAAQVIAANVYYGEVHLFPVPGYADWTLSVADMAEERVRGARRAGSVDPSRLELKKIAGSSAAHGLQDLSEELDVDLIVVGPSQRSRPGQALIGTTAQRLLHGSPCPVSIAPAGFRDTHRPLGRVVAVAYDGSAESKIAMRAAGELVRHSGGRLVLLSVSEAPMPLDGYGYEKLRRAVADETQRLLDEAMARIPYGIWCESVLLEGEAAPALTKAAAQADLLVLGSRSYGPLGRVVMGSVSSSVAVTAPCPVLIYPRGAERLTGRRETAGAAR